MCSRSGNVFHIYPYLVLPPNHIKAIVLGFFSNNSMTDFCIERCSFNLFKGCGGKVTPTASSRARHPAMQKDSLQKPFVTAGEGRNAHITIIVI
jgi:hypothetical protein